MLKITGRGSITTCDGITRRDFLQVGTLGAIGLSLSQYAALQAMGAVAKGNDKKSAIMIFNRPILSESAPNTVKNGMPNKMAMATIVLAFTISTFITLCRNDSA